MTTCACQSQDCEYPHLPTPKNPWKRINRSNKQTLVHTHTNTQTRYTSTTYAFTHTSAVRINSERLSEKLAKKPWKIQGRCVRQEDMRGRCLAARMTASILRHWRASLGIPQHRSPPPPSQLVLLTFFVRLVQWSLPLERYHASPSWFMTICFFWPV